MKNTNDKDRQLLETALKKAYREQKSVTVDEQWSSRVMQTIRMHGPLKTISGSPSFGWLVWRLAPVSLVLIFVLTVCTLYFGFVPEYEMARFFVTDPIDFTLIESLGI